MKPNVVLGTLFSAALATSVAAQTGSAGSQGGTQGSGSQNQRGKTVTVTGCLQNADMASGGTSGTSGTGTSGSSASGSSATGAHTGASKSAGAKFVLNNARMGGGSATTGSGTSGSAATGTATSGTSAQGGDAMNFHLTGGNQAQLKKHLNSQVEIRGTLQASGSGSSASGSTAQPGQSVAHSAQMLRVTSVKQIAASCSSQNR